MGAIKVETMVDEAAARAIPALRPLLGKRIELIAQESEAGLRDRPRKLTVDEFFATRLMSPAGVHVSLDDMEKAIERGATGGVD